MNSSGAHYQHRKTGIELLLRAPVREPVAMTWGDGGSVFAGTSEGKVYSVHPAEGTKILVTKAGGAVCGLAYVGSYLWVVWADGRWAALDEQGEVCKKGKHPFKTQVDVVIVDGELRLVGECPKRGRHMVLYEGEKRKFRVELPPGTVAMKRAGGGLDVAQPIEAGMEWMPMFSGRRFQETNAAGFRLMPVGHRLVGVRGDEIRVWWQSAGELATATTKLPDVISATVSPDGSILGLGTSTGAIVATAISAESKGQAGGHLVVHGCKGPVRCLSFSPCGEFLLSGAKGLRIWGVDAA